MFQRGGQGFAGLDVIADALDQRAHLSGAGLLEQQGQRAFQRLAGPQQRRQLLGKTHQRRALQLLTWVAQQGSAGGFNLQQQQAALVQGGDGGNLIRGFQRTVLRHALVVQGAELEQAHALSPRVTRSTSSNEVIPAKA